MPSFGLFPYINDTAGQEVYRVDNGLPVRFEADTMVVKKDGTTVVGIAGAAAISQGDIVKVDGKVITVTSSALEEIGKVTALTGTLTTQAQIDAARTQYNKLNAEAKKLAVAVTELQKIQSAELTLVDNMPLNTKEEVAAARAAFNALPADTKVAVSPVSPTAAAVLGAIEAAEAGLVITTVDNLITAIPDSSDPTFAAKVQEAKTAYDALTGAQKDLLADEAKLLNAVAELEAINNVAAAKAALTTLTVVDADRAVATIEALADHANGATYDFPASFTTDPAEPVGSGAAVIDANGDIQITRSAGAGAESFTFDITVTIEDENNLITDTVVFTVTVPVEGNVTVE